METLRYTPVHDITFVIRLIKKMLHALTSACIG